MRAPEAPIIRSDDDRAAVCALVGLTGIGTQALLHLEKAHASLSAAVTKGAAAIAKTPGLRSDAAKSLEDAPDLAKRGAWLLAKAKELGAAVLVLGEPAYPAKLAPVHNAPPVLYVQGSLGDGKKVAVVGSRESDEYGLAAARKIVARLCGAGLDVVSGGAFGVDKAAHEKALQVGGRTIAVVGTGLLNPFPADHRGLYERIAAKGAVVSEFALDAGGNPGHFPRRNRTMAGLCDAVVVTRGTATSGALITCEAAHQAGRKVFAVPGRVDEKLAEAPNGLLSKGVAQALVNGTELFRALDLAVPEVATVPQDTAAVPELPENAKKLLAVLGPHPRHVDELASEAGLTTGEGLAELLRLELLGLCATRPGKYFLRR